MSSTHTSRLLLPATAAALAVLTAGCAGNSSSSLANGATASASPAASASASLQTIRLRYASGKVTGASGRVKVALGTTVALVVTSDVADEVHLHGYDKSADVAKGGTATITFRASKPGIFEVELESLKRRLVQLQVQ
jgi:plastocyanin